MTDLSALDYIWAVITPTTLAVLVTLAIVLAFFLWTSERHVPNVMFFYIWITGFTFGLALAVARWVDGGPMWAVWLGASLLWSWYIAWATAFIAIARVAFHKK